MTPALTAPVPLSLDDLVRTPATWFGAGVSRVELTCSDGRRVSIDLPRPFVLPDSDEQLRERSVIEFMRRFPEGDRVKGQTIAGELGEEYDTVRKTLSDMVRREILFARQGVSGYSRGRLFPKAGQ